MAAPILSALLKVALPLAAVGVVLALAKKKGISWQEEIGFVAPKLPTMAAWLTLWLIVVFIEESIIRRFGLEQAKLWPEMPLLDCCFSTNPREISM